MPNYGPECSECVFKIKVSDIKVDVVEGSFARCHDDLIDAPHLVWTADGATIRGGVGHAGASSRIQMAYDGTYYSLPYSWKPYLRFTWSLEDVICPAGNIRSEIIVPSFKQRDKEKEPGFPVERYPPFVPWLPEPDTVYDEESNILKGIYPRWAYNSAFNPANNIPDSYQAFAKGKYVPIPHGAKATKDIDVWFVGVPGDQALTNKVCCNPPTQAARDRLQAALLSPNCCDYIRKKLSACCRVHGINNEQGKCKFTLGEYLPRTAFANLGATCPLDLPAGLTTHDQKRFWLRGQAEAFNRNLPERLDKEALLYASKPINRLFIGDAIRQGIYSKMIDLLERCHYNRGGNNQFYPVENHPAQQTWADNCMCNPPGVGNPPTVTWTCP